MWILVQNRMMATSWTEKQKIKIAIQVIWVHILSCVGLNYHCLVWEMGLLAVNLDERNQEKLIFHSYVPYIKGELSNIFTLIN